MERAVGFIRKSVLERMRREIARKANTTPRKRNWRKRRINAKPDLYNDDDCLTCPRACGQQGNGHCRVLTEVDGGLRALHFSAGENSVGDCEYWQQQLAAALAGLDALTDEVSGG
jgi:hypothetical protein